MKVAASKNKNHRALLLAFVGFALSTMLASFSIYNSLYFLYVCFVLFLIFTLVAYIQDPTILSNETSQKKQALIWIFAWLIMFFFCLLHIHLPPSRLLLYFVYAFLFLRLKISIQKRIIDNFVLVLSVLIFISIIEYIIYQFSGIGIVLGNVFRETVTDREIPFLQLPFNLIDQYNNMPRFCGLTEEPGLLGTLCGFLLFYTGFSRRTRFQFYVLLIGGALTLSLAFYIILSFFSLTKIKSLKGTLLTILIGGLLSVGFYHIFQEEVESFIIERIAENTLESLDNRSSESFDYYFFKSVKSGQILFGTGGYIPDDVFSRTSGGGYSKGIAGAKKWIYQYGLICFLIIFWAYISIYRKRKSELKYEDYVFLIIFWLSFYQRETILESYTFLAYMGVPYVSYSMKTLI